MVLLNSAIKCRIANSMPKYIIGIMKHSTGVIRHYEKLTALEKNILQFILNL